MKYFLPFLISQIVNSCNYVANFQYGGTDEYNGQLFELNVCHPEMNHVNGITYHSRVFYCDPDIEGDYTVRVNEYMNHHCHGQPGFSTIVRPIDHLPGNFHRAEYAQRCDYIGECTSKAIAGFSKRSIHNFLHDKNSTCNESFANDDFELSTQLTNICIDTSFGDETIPDQSAINMCNSSGLYRFEYSGSKSCEGTPENILWANSNGCTALLIPTQPEVLIYTKVTYCNGEEINSNTTDEPTKMPTLMPSSSTTTPAPTKKPSSSAPAFISFFLYFNTAMIIVSL